MAGYSGKPLSEKLGIKPGCAVAPINPPSDYRELLAPLPAGVRFRESKEQPDVIHYFCTERSRLGVMFQ